MNDLLFFQTKKKIAIHQLVVTEKNEAEKRASKGKSHPHTTAAGGKKINNSS